MRLHGQRVACSRQSAALWLRMAQFLPLGLFVRIASMDPAGAESSRAPISRSPPAFTYCHRGPRCTKEAGRSLPWERAIGVLDLYISRTPNILYFGTARVTVGVSVEHSACQGREARLFLNQTRSLAPTACAIHLTRRCDSSMRSIWLVTLRPTQVLTLVPQMSY
jgi:hypothetical protein